MPGILPEMSIEESLDVTRIYSVADQLPAGTPLIRHVPFEHRIIPSHMRVWWRRKYSEAWRNLTCPSRRAVPGRVSRIRHASVLEVMRQPMEDKVVTISRAKGSLNFLCQLSTNCCHESLPLRILWGLTGALFLRAGTGDKVSETHFRPITGPHRYSYRSPTCGL